MTELKNDPLVDEAIRVFQGGMRNTLKRRGLEKVSRRAQARALNIEHTMLGRWLTLGQLPTHLVLRRVQATFGFSREDLRTIRRGIARRFGLSRQGVRTSAAEERVRTRRAARTRQAKSPTEVKAARPPTPPARPATYERALREIDGILAQTSLRGAADQRARRADDHWTVDGMPFVLTRQNFTPLDGKHWTAETTQETIRVAQELRRRLLTLAQLHPERARKESLRTLAAELTELFIAYTAANAVVPIRCVETIEEQMLRERIQ